MWGEGERRQVPAFVENKGTKPQRISDSYCVTSTHGMSEQRGLVNVVGDRMAIETSKRLLGPLLSILNDLNVSTVPVRSKARPIFEA